jgi:hypothetical protein
VELEVLGLCHDSFLGFEVIYESKLLSEIGSTGITIDSAFHLFLTRFSM